MSGRRLLLTQLTSLCRMYQKMENYKLFHNSPQRVHLGQTISKLFEFMHNEDKMKLYKHFSVDEDSNVSLWSCLKITNLPDQVRHNAGEKVADKLMTQYRNFVLDDLHMEGINKLINTVSLAATCSFIRNNEMTDCLIKLWEKTCPRHNKLVIHGGLDKGTLWYLQYIEALLSFTDSMEHILHERSAILAKVLHVISQIVKLGNTEFKLIVIRSLCKIAAHATCDENKNIVESLLVQSFKELFQDASSVIESQLHYMIKEYNGNKNLDNIVCKVFKEDVTLNERWAYFNKHNVIKQSREWKELLSMAKGCRYHHKCLENKNTVIEMKDSPQDLKRSCSNFDFADIDTLFENESNSEQPECKKVKLSDNEADAIIARLENDASLLCKIKENIFTSEHKNRIKNVSVKLKNITD